MNIEDLRTSLAHDINEDDVFNKIRSVGMMSSEALSADSFSILKCLLELFYKPMEWLQPSILEAFINASADSLERRFLVLALACNLTCKLPNCEFFETYVKDIPATVRELSKALLDNRSPNIDHAASVLRNLTQLKSVRDFLFMEDLGAPLIITLLNSNKYAMHWQREILFDIVRNCCFDAEKHTIISSMKEQFFTGLMYSFFGYGEFRDWEWQLIYPGWRTYLTAAIEREANCRIRFTILEALYRISASRAGREAMRSLGIYFVLREYHKWETNADANELCGNVIGILIQTEEEIGCDNIMEWSLEEQNFVGKLQSTSKETKAET
ncbi:Protein HGH1 [Trichinella pseudospiralis]